MGIFGDIVGSLEGKVPILEIRYSQLLLAALKELPVEFQRKGIEIPYPQMNIHLYRP